MKKYSDSILAKSLLEKRHTKSSLRFFYKKNLKLNIRHLCVCVVGVMLFLWGRVPIGFVAFVLGLYVELFLRDFQWFSAQKKIWPFTEKVIDWQKVEEFADINADTK